MSRVQYTRSHEFEDTVFTVIDIKCPKSILFCKNLIIFFNNIFLIHSLFSRYALYFDCYSNQVCNIFFKLEEA